jgi:hypothetical protein
LLEPFSLIADIFQLTNKEGGLAVWKPSLFLGRSDEPKLGDNSKRRIGKLGIKAAFQSTSV